MWFYNTNKANKTASKNVQVNLVKASTFGDGQCLKAALERTFFPFLCYLSSSLLLGGSAIVMETDQIFFWKYQDLPSNVQHKNHIEQVPLRRCFPIPSWQIGSLSVLPACSDPRPLNNN